MKKKILKFLATALIFGAAGVASAHTISIGVYNAGTPGSVTLAMGTCEHGAPLSQGFMALIAGPVTTAPVAFSSVTTIKPVLLVDGVNNFYADSNPSTWGTLPADSFHSATNTVGIGAVVNWQELTFTGLVAGTYTYQLTGMTSANWTNINSFTNNWTGTLVIEDSVVNPTPEPGTLALLGLGLFGLGLSRRRKTH